jgi:hypothetical protein
MFELDFPKVEAGTEGEAEQVKKFKAVSDASRFFVG